MKKLLLGLFVLGSLSSFAQVSPPAHYSCSQITNATEISSFEEVKPLVDYLKELPMVSCEDFSLVGCGHLLNTSNERYEMKCKNESSSYKLFVKIIKKGKKDLVVKKVKMIINN